jgi:hypothetical protein
MSDATKGFAIVFISLVVCIAGCIYCRESGKAIICAEIQWNSPTCARIKQVDLEP